MTQLSESFTANSKSKPERNAVPLQTEEELHWVKEMVILPVILDVLEKDIHALQPLPLKMPELYIQVLRRAQDQASRDLSRLRRELGKRGVKIYDQRRTTQGIEASYVCRGYHYRFSMLWGLVKAEVAQRLSVYLGLDAAPAGALRP